MYESFLYRREKAAGDKVYWTCRDQARMGCRSRAITQGRQVTVMRGHCHPPDLLGLETLRQRDKHPSPTHRESLGMWGDPTDFHSASCEHSRKSHSPVLTCLALPLLLSAPGCPDFPHPPSPPAQPGLPSDLLINPGSSFPLVPCHFKSLQYHCRKLTL